MLNDALYALVIGSIYILSLPIQLIIGLLVILLSGFPVLYVQERVGKDGRRFAMYKFRTMKAGSHRLQKMYARDNEADGPVFKLYNDPRYTSLGKFLAHTGLDELPQFWNILQGDMALFGPRPLPVSEERKLKHWQKARERVLPGVISPAILTGNYHRNFDDWMKNDVAYAGSKNITTDTKLFFTTLAFLGKLLRRALRDLLDT